MKRTKVCSKSIRKNGLLVLFLILGIILCAMSSAVVFAEEPEDETVTDVRENDTELLDNDMDSSENDTDSSELADDGQEAEELVGRIDGTGPYGIDKWWAEAKKEAAKADHVIGYDSEVGDIFGYDTLHYPTVHYYKVILPGETIAILPEIGMGGVDGGITYVGFTIWQMEKCAVNTDFLVNSTPEKTTLTPLEEKVMPILFSDRLVDHPDDPATPAPGSISTVTYTSLYRNDTGLPIVLDGARGGYFEEFSNYGLIEGLSQGVWTNFQGGGREYDKTTLIFAEPYYDFVIDKATTYFVYHYQREELDFSKVMWPDPLSNYDLRYYIDGKDHTYEFPIPQMEAYKFFFYENYAGGDFSPNETGAVSGNVFQYTFNFETKSHEFGQPDISNYLRNQYLCPLLDWWPTLRFDAQGGTIDGEATKFVELAGFGTTTVLKDYAPNDPVYEGYIFLGWCTNPDDPEGTLIEEITIEKDDTHHRTVYAAWKEKTDISGASVSGVSRSYGYSGRAYTPVSGVKVNGVALIEGTDYTIKYENNQNPGTATITITGIGNYTGTRIKTFEIVDCVSSLVSGKTYQLIPKNNSSTAVCSYSGRMVNNTKVYITNRSSSEAMRFVAVKNSDGTWKFINAKCELALAVQQNSSVAGKGLVLYDQTTKKAQNWKLTRKSDNSFAITNAVSGLYIAMSDMSAPKGTTLSIMENSGRGDQRFYIAETEAVDAPFDGTYGVKASKNKAYGLNIASSSKTDGANVNLYKYSATSAKKFKVIYSGGGYYRLVNVNSGLVVTVKGNKKANGTNVIQSKWAAQNGQKWKIAENADGTVTFRNALGTVLHLNGNKTANGTNVVAKNAAATGAQKWYLE